MATKRVRIAVVINDEEACDAASVVDGMTDEEGVEYARKRLLEFTVDMNYTAVFIEADIPIPERPTIEGTVVEQTDGN